jgi:Holliday junction DNA helicase RuvA
MIASLKGILETVSKDYVVINVGGIGFQVFAPTSTLSTLGMPGTEARVFTHTHVREDAILLFGFNTPEELKLFQMLINISGFGPKLALSMLSSMDVNQLVSAIAGSSEELLTSVPGVGKKLAGRLILELKDKITSGWGGMTVTPTAEGDGDVVSALLSLGYSANEASRAVAGLPRDKKLSLEEKIKMALGWFGKG